MNLLDACRDPNIFAPWFRDRDTWSAWFAFIAALFALPMTPDQDDLYRRCTGRQIPPTAASEEAWLVCGRRAGKSFVLALIAVYLATFREYRQHLSPGERGTVLIIATDRRQARTIMRYLRALITCVPMIARMIERETADGIDLNNSVTIEVGTASHRSTRGYTLVAALCDELAFWPSDDAAEPDYAILDALRPGMATIPGAVLLCASSPYRRGGALWDAYRRWYGQDEAPALVWKAPTRTMNPTVPQAIIDRASERDPNSAAAEYLAEFRTDVETFVSRDAVEACVSSGVFERPRVDGVRYFAFVDPSGGSADSMTLAISHRGPDDVGVLDAIREQKPPFSPDNTVKDFAALLKSYGVFEVSGDRYAGEWAREPFRKLGITYKLSDRPKSDIYRDSLPMLNARRADLVDSERLVNQIASLERRTGRGGRDSIDHGPGGHDDLANAALGALILAAGGPANHGPLSASFTWG